MKKILSLLMLFTVTVAFALPPDTSFYSFSANGTALNVATNYVIIPQQSVNGGAPVATFASVRGLAATAITLQSYVSTNQTLEVLTNSTTTLYVGNTNGYAPGNWVVIQHLLGSPLARFQCEAGVISAVQNTNQIVLQVAPLNTVNIGDVINQQTSAASISITSATTPTTFTGSGILTGQRNEPWLISISSTGVGTNTIDALNAQFPFP